jgi:Tol biopolymer transport system component
MPETRLEIVTPPTSAPASFALSPDGRRIAYVATLDGISRLWMRALDSTSAQPLPGTEGALNPFWSPDSRSLGFLAGDELKRIDLGGGQPQILAVVPPVAAQGTWSAEDVVLFGSGASAPLSRVPAQGGQAVAATKLEPGQIAHRAPRFLPSGRQFLFLADGAEPGIWLGSLNGGQPRRLGAIAPGADSAGESLAPGWLIRVRQNALAAQRFDADRGQFSGDAITLAPAVGVDPRTQAGAFSASPSGTIAWRAGEGARRQLIWFNRAGQRVEAIGAEDPLLLNPELSPDGKRAAVTRGRIDISDVWILESTRSNRFTFDPADDRITIWSPDGARVVFASKRKGRFGLYQKSTSGTGGEDVLLESADPKFPNSWSLDGRSILYWSNQNSGDLMVLPLAGDRKPFPFLSTPFNEEQGVFSPDGKWVAYASNESGRFEVYVRPLAGPGGQWRISPGGGNSPRWRADGKDL